MKVHRLTNSHLASVDINVMPAKLVPYSIRELESRGGGKEGTKTLDGRVKPDHDISNMKVHGLPSSPLSGVAINSSPLRGEDEGEGE